MSFLRIVLFALVTATLTCGPTTLAQTLMSTNYSIQWDVVDGGGGVLMSSNYTLTDSVVQPSAIGESMSVGYTLQAGFMGHRMMTGMV